MCSVSNHTELENVMKLLKPVSVNSSVICGLHRNSNKNVKKHVDV